MTAAVDWQESAVCRSVDPDLFFPEQAGPSHEAKRVCAACPVRIECLAYALAHRDRYGIWGGLTARERRRLIPSRPYARREIRHGTAGGYYTHRRRDEQPCGDCQQAASEQWRRKKERRRVVARVSEIRETVVA